MGGEGDAALPNFVANIFALPPFAPFCAAKYSKILALTLPLVSLLLPSKFALCDILPLCLLLSSVFLLRIYLYLSHSH